MSSPIEYIEYEVLDDAYTDCSETEKYEENKFFVCETISNDLTEATDSNVNSEIKKDNEEIILHGFELLYSDSECTGSYKAVKKNKPKRAKKPKPRTRNPELWKQNIRIRLREKGLPYINSSGVEMPAKTIGPTCSPTICSQKCTQNISNEERQRIHEDFWNLSYKEKQIFYSKSIKRTEIKRRRAACSKEADPMKKHSYEYYFNVNDRSIKVCKKYFINTLSISAGTVSSFLAKNYGKDIIQSLSKPSNRGRKRKIRNDDSNGDGVTKGIDDGNILVNCKTFKRDPEDEASPDNDFAIVKHEDETEFVCCPTLNNDAETDYLNINEDSSCEGTSEAEATDYLEIGKEIVDKPAIKSKIEDVNFKSKESTKNSEAWKRNICQNICQKDLPNTSGGVVDIPETSMGPLCTSACFYSCARKITSKNRKLIFEKFAELSYEEKQKFYSNCIKKVEIKRKKPYGNKENDPKTQSRFQYFFNVNNRTIRVCKTYFRNTLGVSATVINSFLAKQLQRHALQSCSKLSNCSNEDFVRHNILNRDSFSDGTLIEADNKNKLTAGLTPNSDTEIVAPNTVVKFDNESKFNGCAFSSDEPRSNLKTDEEAENDTENGINCTNQSVSSQRKKRARNPEMWKQNIRKNLRQKGLPYVNSSGVEMPGKSIGPTCNLMCLHSCTKKISGKKRQRIHDNFWNLTFEEKHEFYRHNIKRCEIKRRRSECQQEIDPKRKNSFKYYLNVNNSTIQVCKKYFINTLAISAGTVSHFFANQAEESFSKSSKRGRKGYSQDQIEEVKSHIRSFPTVKKGASTSSCAREYLDESLNVTKMFNLYKEETTNPVGLQTYRNVFNTCFAYSFYNPKKDNT